MAKVSPNARGPNTTYIPPARVGARIRHYRLALGSPGFTLGLLAFNLCWAARLFETSHAIVLLNVKPQREGVCVVVEYRLKVRQHRSMGD